MGTPELVAHRGYPLRYPENTLVGIDAALQSGARYLEVDVQLSADRVPVLFHDRTLKRVCGVPGAVHERTLADLGALRASDPGAFGETYRDVPLATLDGLCETLAANPRVTVFVEVKPIAVERFGVSAVLDAVLGRLRPFAERCVLISFVPDVLREAGRRDRQRRGLILKRWSQASRPETIDLGVDYLVCNVVKLPRARDLRVKPFRLSVYDVVEPAKATALTARGAELVETFAIREMLGHFAAGSGTP